MIRRKIRRLDSCERSYFDVFRVLLPSRMILFSCFVWVSNHWNISFHIYTSIHRFSKAHSKQNETRLFRRWKTSGKPVGMINIPLFSGVHTRTPLRWQSLIHLGFLESLISSGQSGASSYRFKTGESVRKFLGEIFRGNSWMRVFGSVEKWRFFFDGKEVCNV